ncbi:MAG: hypothetical protein EHM64_10695 [Ignavibacteriae bacterium]|nr:MAG: hypothetical protein EHM64_10695 [Ignavibacteriota bacterium]
MEQFNRDEKRVFSKASRKTIEDYLASLSKRTFSRKWLHQNNRYRKYCTKRYEQDLGSAIVPPSVDIRDLTHYIASSAPTHSIDGWSFLGRAVDSALRGDTYSAIHFAYYAELRAAMSLMASEGVGVFSSKHATINRNRNWSKFPPRYRREIGGTHKIIWPMLQYWSTLQRSSDLINEIINPNPFHLSGWLDTLNVRSPIRAIAKHWMTSWGLDISVVEDDHNSRNYVSYRPSEFRKPKSLDIHEIVEFVEELWVLFEPTGLGKFALMEKYLVKKAWQESGVNNPTQNELQRKGLNLVQSMEWFAFLNNPGLTLPFTYAENNTSIEDPYCHLQVISRAALLLFVSTMASRKLLTDAAFRLEMFSFWWSQHGRERGLWNDGGIPVNPIDIWSDIETILNDSKNWRRLHPRGSVSSFDWRNQQPNALNWLGGFELVGIWGLLP